MEVRVLGPVEIGATSAGPPKQQVLLAVLALSLGQTVPVETLVARVWGDLVPDAVQTSVHAYIARLRRLLAPTPARLIRRGNGYALDADPAWVDLHRARQLARRAAEATSPDDAAALYRAALTCWRGEPLSGLKGDWVDRARESLVQERLALLIDRFAVELDRGRHALILGDLAEAVAAYPFAEPLHGQLMLALYRSGRVSEALRRFVDARRRIRDELGVEPGRDLRDLHQRILRDDVDPALSARSERPATPAQLPADVAGFTGRAAVLAHLDTLLAGDGTAVAIGVISGSAGVGKTAVAVHWAHRAAARFPDGQLFLNLQGFAARPPLSPADAVARLLRSLGMPPAQIPVDVDEASAAYRSLLAGRRVMVVLDDAATAEQVRVLLPGAPTCLVVVTSRHRLVDLVAVDGARHVALGTLPPREAIDLLARTVGAERVAAERDAADDLVGVCAHLPLAVRVAAANLALRPHQTITRYVAALTDDRLAPVRAAFDLSYRALDPPARRVFRLLGHEHDVTPAAAAALAGIEVPAAGRMLDELCAEHLVEPHPGERFGMHDLLRTYAEELATPDELGPAVERLVTYYVRCVDAAEPLLRPDRRRPGPPPLAGVPEPPAFVGQEEALGWFERERANLVRAVGSASDGLAWRLADGLFSFLNRRAYHSDFLRTQELGVDAAMRLGDVEIEARMRNGLACALWVLRRLDEGAKQAGMAAKLAGDVGDRELMARAMLNLSGIRAAQGLLDESGEGFQVALELARDARVPTLAIAALHSLGELHLQTGDHAAALASLGEALELVTETGEQWHPVLISASFGRVYVAVGDLDRARHHAEVALDLARQTGDVGCEAEAWDVLGHCHAASEPDTARAFWQKAFVLYSSSSAHDEAAAVKVRLAAVSELDGDPAMALPGWGAAVAT